MYFFDKKTMYLVWNMQEGQARGVGTVKFLAMDEICRIEVVITACGKVQGTYPVYVLSGGMQSLLGEITLNKGKGNLYLKCSTNSLGHKVFPYKKVTGLYIDLKSEGYLEQKWLPIQEEVCVERKEHRVAVKDDEEITKKKEPESKRMPERVKAEKEVKKQEVLQEKIQKEPETKQEIKKSAEEVKPPEKNNMVLYPDKWQQLCAIYPVVHPFQDGRAYLSIEPRDFVVLQERFQPMVQNSFLLHGFYYYRHLLLGRMKQGKNVQYYLGVPGVFYEKEKAAALFYGFESFEGAVTPAKEGSFGYYMKRVQI